MINSRNNVKLNFKEDNINNHYIYNDKSTRFIYDNSSLTLVVGISKLLQGKIVEIVNEFENNGKKIVQLKVDDEIVGWIEITGDVLIRLYRLPKVSGKLNPHVQLSDFYNISNQNLDLKTITDKILKLHYVFYYEQQEYFNLSTIDGKNSFSVKGDLFNRLIFLSENQTIFLDENYFLYNSHNFSNKVGVVKEAKNYNILTYINNTNEVKVDYNGENYWVKTNDIHSAERERYDIESLEVVDFITYLYQNNKYNENRVKILNNKIQKIGENISYYNENEEIRIKKYLGEYHDN